MNNFDVNTESVNDLMKWLRKPKIYWMPIFDILVILALVHWFYGYIKYIGFILLILFVNNAMTNPQELPPIVKQYFGMT